jgi:sugar phosphate isomerase/epimerase
MIKGIGISAYGPATDGRLDGLAQELQEVGEAGFDAYELPLPACNVIRCGKIDRDELERVAAVFDRQPLKATVHAAMSLRLTDPTGFHEQVFLSSLEVVHRIHAEVMVYHSAQLALYPADQDTGPLPTMEALAAMWRSETEALRRMAHHAERLGVVIAVENRDPHLWEIAALRRHGKTANELTLYHQGMRLDLIAEQVRAVGSPNVGMCLDVGHAFLAAPHCGADYLAQIRAVASEVKHVHWHDNFGRLDDRSESLAERLTFGEADNHLPPGRGAIPLAEVLAVLMQSDYRGWLMVEIRPRYSHMLQEIAATARHMAHETL